MSPQPSTIPGGLVIVFDGIDGVGKTTQLELARQELEAGGWPVYATRNLGGTPIGEALRDVMKSPLARPGTTNLYLSAAIQEALIGVIQDQRHQNKIILMDRGPLSLAAYEIYGSHLDEALGWPHVEAGMSSLNPELTIIYDTDVKTALGRARQKPEKADYFESQPPDFFERVAEGYKTAARRYPGQVTLVEAGQPIEAVHAKTMELVRQLLAEKSGQA